MAEPDEARRGGWTRRLVLGVVPSSWALRLFPAAAEQPPMPRPDPLPDHGDEVFEKGVFAPGVFE
jgi:hypothetical protein